MSWLPHCLSFEGELKQNMNELVSGSKNERKKQHLHRTYMIGFIDTTSGGSNKTFNVARSFSQKMWQIQVEIQPLLAEAKPGTKTNFVLSFLPSLVQDQEEQEAKAEWVKRKMAGRHLNCYFYFKLESHLFELDPT